MGLAAANGWGVPSPFCSGLEAGCVSSRLFPASCRARWPGPLPSRSAAFGSAGCGSNLSAGGARRAGARGASSQVRRCMGVAWHCPSVTSCGWKSSSKMCQDPTGAFHASCLFKNQFPATEPQTRASSPRSALAFGGAVARPHSLRALAVEGGRGPPWIAGGVGARPLEAGLRLVLLISCKDGGPVR